MDKILKNIVESIEDKKGENIRVIDVTGLTEVTDYMIIASGNNTNQVQAICDNVTDNLAKEFSIIPKNTEGYHNAEWILVDCGDYIIHVFDKDQRMFYNIERIWNDGKEVEI